MPDVDPIHEQDAVNADSDAELKAPSPRQRIRRLVVFGSVLFVVLMLILLPPLLNVNRFQRSIARNIGMSLGRPVHMDRVSLTLLPTPGFILENFVVNEDPTFGNEPIIRAATVHARLRVSSLWSRRFEFSSISLTEPSINLVHTADGRWNIESIFLQAARIEAAPTAQSYVSAAPRFPYIEATGARINLKLDQVKTPFSLTDADFALWLPEPHQWHVRLEAHPSRTDTAPAEIGTLRVEGTLGRATTLADVPVSLHGELRKAQLGGASQFILGRDAGLRGELTLTAGVVGTIGNNAVEANLALGSARRAEFIPPHLLALETHCTATAQGNFHSFSDIECRWPAAGSSDRSVMILAGSVPDIRQPRAASFDLTVPALPSTELMDWIRVASRYPPEGLLATGTLAGNLAYNGIPQKSGGSGVRPRAMTIPLSTWSGEFDVSGETLQLADPSAKPIPLGEITLLPASAVDDGANARPLRNPKPSPARAAAATGFVLSPIALPLGGKEPATLEGHFDTKGYTLHLTGNVVLAQLIALGEAVPQLGSGLREILDPAATEGNARPVGGEKVSVSLAASAPVAPASAPDPASAPVHVDLTADRPWGGPQAWHQTPVAPHHIRGN
jgi:hypothetical protein